MEPSPPLQDRTALVTGASSGIGRAIALELARQGARVILSARREERLREVAQSISEMGGEAHPVVADFSQEPQIVQALEVAASWADGFDILINSAGVALQSPLSDGDAQEWRTMWETNVLGLAIASREALRHFPETGGHIIHLGSMSGHRVPGKGGFYAATKFAVRAMTEGLRQELRAAGNPTRVSQVSPGFVDTELLDAYFHGAKGDRYQAVDYPMLQPEDIAATVLHILLAPAHADITDVLLRPHGQKA